MILLRAIPTLNGNSWRLHLSFPSNGCICVAARAQPWAALGVQLSGIYGCICVAAREQPWAALGLQLSGICGAVYVSFASVVCICH